MEGQALNPNIEDAPEKPTLPPMRSFRLRMPGFTDEVIDAHSISIDGSTLMFFELGTSGKQYCKHAFFGVPGTRLDELATTALSSAIN